MQRRSAAVEHPMVNNQRFIIVVRNWLVVVSDSSG